MTYFEFNLLPEEGKIKEIGVSGTLIAERRKGICKYELYQLEDFYVEQLCYNFWNIRKTNRTFRTTCYLEPYLADIDISAVLT